MRVVAIVGSRTYPATKKEWDRLDEEGRVGNDETAIERIDYLLDKLDPEQHLILSGAAPGVDQLAVEIAEAKGFQTWELPADWKKYGKGAGFKRNTDIALAADEVVAFWDGVSNGTRDTLKKARKYHKPYGVIGPGGSLMEMMEEGDYPSIFSLPRHEPIKGKRKPAGPLTGAQPRQRRARYSRPVGRKGKVRNGR